MVNGTYNYVINQHVQKNLCLLLVVIREKLSPNTEISQNIIDILVENKADVNAKDKDGNTPLHHAAIRGNTDIIETLIKQGANPLLKNINNEIPKDLWDDSCYPSSVNLYSSYKKDLILSEKALENYLQENCELQCTEESQYRSKTIKIVNLSKNDSFKHEQHNNKKFYILGCVAGSVAIAYFLGAAALTSVYVAIYVFVGMILAGALIGYSITKLCENKVETKIESTCANQHNVQEIAV